MSKHENEANRLNLVPIAPDGSNGILEAMAALDALEPDRLLDEFRERQSVYYLDATFRRFLRQLRILGVNMPADKLGIALKYATKLTLGWMWRVMA